jgi:hypothetical protein
MYFFYGSAIPFTKDSEDVEHYRYIVKRDMSFDTKKCTLQNGGVKHLFCTLSTNFDRLYNVDKTLRP